MSGPDVRRGRPRQGNLSGDRASSHRQHTASSYPPGGLEVAIDNAGHDWWFGGGMTAIRQLARRTSPFTVDDLVDLVGQPPAANYWGALFAAATRRGLIEAVGCQLGRDGRMVRRWYGTEPSS